jgi:homoserine dehydrogenase
MQEEGVDLPTALAEAQRRGYAEADPSDDIEGKDAANKLAILSAVAFGTAPDLGSIYVEGIRAVTQDHLREADANGGRIKLLGIATRTPQGIVQRVQPVFVPLHEHLARVDGVVNALEICGDFAGETLIQGQGAGAPTASSIVADLIDIARGHRSFAFGVAVENLSVR